MSIYMHVHMYVYVCVYMYMCMYTCVYMYMYVYMMCICICKCICAQIFPNQSSPLWGPRGCCQSCWVRCAAEFGIRILGYCLHIRLTSMENTAKLKLLDLHQWTTHTKTFFCYIYGSRGATTVFWLTSMENTMNLFLMYIYGTHTGKPCFLTHIYDNTI